MVRFLSDTLLGRLVGSCANGLTIGVLLLTALAPIKASAILISVDDLGGFGADSLTRDTNQGLDFLDLTFSLGRTFNDVSVEFGVGGDFEGFRYATVDEVITLANNFGVNPPFTPGDFGDPGIDIGELVDLLGATDPGGPFNRSSTGITSSSIMAGSRRLVEFIDEFDNVSFTDRISSEPNFSTRVDFTFEETGSFLVRQAETSSVPVPSTLVLILAGLVIAARSRL